MNFLYYFQDKPFFKDMKELEQLKVIQGIISAFEEAHKRVTDAALNSPKGGDANWYQILKEYEIQPVSLDMKNRYYSSGMPVTKGALPTELRKVYETLRFLAIKSYRDRIGDNDLEGEADDLWDKFDNRLRYFVKDDTDSYIGMIKQKVGVSDIFANAFMSMNQFSHGLKESGTKTKMCENCGAPRLDTDQYEECYFCGTPLFATEKVQAKCPICGAPKFLEDQNKPCRFCNH
jgi:hypothetical protein